jgi:hypothetical protein
MEVWLRLSLEEARKVTRSATWTPPTPKELIALIANSDARIVRTGDELLEASISSIRRLQKKLKGVTPMAFQYWDETSSRPKTETRISDAIKDHLETDLKLNAVVVNREVEIRNINSKGMGDRTDILVQALPLYGHQESEAISAVIEVNGCWNADLDTAMEIQLKNGYLENTGYSSGLYLVAWFLSDRWDGKDYRKSECLRFARSRSLEEITRSFEDKAKKLSNNGLRIRAYVLDATY